MSTQRGSAPVCTTSELKTGSLLYTPCHYFLASEEWDLLALKGKARESPAERKWEVRATQGRPSALCCLIIPR